MFVRLAKVKDCQEIYDLIKDGDSGMTTLPKSKKEVLERISWSKNSYWGEPDKFKFKAGISTFTDASEFEGERIIKTTFDLSMKGYLLPESFNSIVNTQKEYSKRIGLELGVE